MDLRLICGNNQIIAVPDALDGELIADAGGRPGDDGKLLRRGTTHGTLPFSSVQWGFITTLMQPSFLSRNVL